jgi:hypothetical protein
LNDVNSVVLVVPQEALVANAEDLEVPLAVLGASLAKEVKAKIRTFQEGSAKGSPGTARTRTSRTSSSKLRT